MCVCVCNQTKWLGVSDSSKTRKLQDGFRDHLVWGVDKAQWWTMCWLRSHVHVCVFVKPICVCDARLIKRVVSYMQESVDMSMNHN